MLNGRMEEVDYYNICLQAVGQTKVTAIDVYDPDVAEIQVHIENASNEILNMAWAFNTNMISLRPDPSNDNKVSVSGYLRYVLPVGLERLTDSGGFLWDPDNNVFWTTQIDNVAVTTGVDFPDIPLEVGRAIAHKAAVTFLIQVKGVVPEVGYWQQRERNFLAVAEMKYPCDMGIGSGSNRIISQFNF